MLHEPTGQLRSANVHDFCKMHNYVRIEEQVEDIYTSISYSMNASGSAPTDESYN